MKNKNIIWSFLMLLALLPFSCKNEIGPVLNVTTNILEFSMEDFEKVVSITNDGDEELFWSVSNIPHWLSLSVTGGNILEGKNDIILTANINQEVGDYTATLHFESNGGEHDLIVKMKVDFVPEVFPGESAADIEIGADFDDVFDRYGNNIIYVFTIGDYTLYYTNYDNKGLTFYTEVYENPAPHPSDTNVFAIYMDAPYEGKTENNIGIEDAKSNVEMAYGLPDNISSSDWHEYNIGIQFQYESSKVVKMAVEE